jgi:mutator protein MutT
MKQDYFVVPQKAVIMDGNKYLILKRSKEAVTYPNHWDFPGGRLEKGENTSEALEREVMEETTLKVKAIKPLFTFHEILNERKLVFIVYLCEKISGEVKLSHEHTEYRWATREEILKLDIENYLRAYLRAVNE